VLLIATDKGGVSALRLQATLKVSYRTAWDMLRKLRAVQGSCLASLTKDALACGIQKVLHSKDRAAVEALVLSKQDEAGREKICLVKPGLQSRLPGLSA